MKDNLNLFYDLQKKAAEGGGKEKISKQRKQNKYLARERIEMLLDKGTFREIDMFVTHNCHNLDMEKNKTLSDGVITGFGYINGRLVYVYSQDFTVFGGSLGLRHAEKICKVMDKAVKSGAPLIGINDSGGARIQEGVESLAGYGEIFYRNTVTSGVIPQISIISGPCAGGAVYSPGITDFIVMNETNSYMFITGPEVIKAVTNEEVTFEQLGGAKTHSSKSGVAHFTTHKETDAYQLVRRLLSFIPQNNLSDPPRLPVTDSPKRAEKKLMKIIPPSPNKPYDMKEVIQLIVDNEDFLEVHENWARNIIVGFGRMAGRSVGFVANNPRYLAGVLDIDASIKAARFVRFCDAFNIPLVTLTDVPGFLPGTNQEYGGIIRHGAKLLYAYSEATVPKISVILRKAYGGAYLVMCSKHLRSDYNFAWPSAEIAVMGEQGAINIIYKKELATAENPEQKRKELEGIYQETFTNPYIAASLGYIDDVIEPKETRPCIIEALETLTGKRDVRPPRKHGNIPL